MLPSPQTLDLHPPLTPNPNSTFFDTILHHLHNTCSPHTLHSAYTPPTSFCTTCTLSTPLTPYTLPTSFYAILHHLHKIHAPKTHTLPTPFYTTCTIPASLTLHPAYTLPPPFYTTCTISTPLKTTPNTYTRLYTISHHSTPPAQYLHQTVHHSTPPAQYPHQTVHHSTPPAQYLHQNVPHLRRTLNYLMFSPNFFPKRAQLSGLTFLFATRGNKPLSSNVYTPFSPFLEPCKALGPACLQLLRAPSLTHNISSSPLPLHS